MVLSQVPKIELTENGNVKLIVEIAGLRDEKSVEISGYVTQNDADKGVFASFREAHVVVKPDASGVAETPVIVPHDQLKLMVDRPVTVVTWVSEIWPSVLTPNLDREAAGKARQSWTINQAASHYEQLALAAADESGGSSRPVKTARDETARPDPSWPGSLLPRRRIRRRRPA